MTVLEIASTAIAVLLAASRLLSAAKPLWSRAPDWLQAALPALMLWIPQAVEALGQAETKMDLVELVVLTVALLVPGAHTRDRDDPPGGAGSEVGLASRILPTLGLALFVVLSFGCASIPPQFKDVANEAGARTAVMTACSLGHSYDGKVSAATAVVEICSKQEYAEPWIEITKQIAELVKAQRKGLARPAKEEPVEPTPAPAPPPKPVEEPAMVPKPATEA
jgi:hypothetical protein